MFNPYNILIIIKIDCSFWNLYQQNPEMLMETDYILNFLIYLLYFIFQNNTSIIYCIFL